MAIYEKNMNVACPSSGKIVQKWIIMSIIVQLYAIIGLE